MPQSTEINYYYVAGAAEELPRYISPNLINTLSHSSTTNSSPRKKKSNHASSSATSSPRSRGRRPRSLLDSPELLSSVASDDASSSGSAPHICGICSAIFLRREHLYRHQRSHTNDRPHICPECDRSFTRSDNLRTHRRTVHGVDCGGYYGSSAYQVVASNYHGMSSDSQQRPRRILHKARSAYASIVYPPNYQPKDEKQFSQSKESNFFHEQSNDSSAFELVSKAVQEQAEKSAKGPFEGLSNNFE